MLAIALEAAEAAGALLIDGLGRVRTAVDTKSSPTDMVTEVDRASEVLVARMIRAARPADGIVGEEGTDEPGTSGVRWLIDPLDGTTNYLYSYPAFSVSIAAEFEGETVAGVVHDPLRNEVFAGRAGDGSTCNGRALRVSGASSLATTLLGTGFSYEPDIRREQGALIAELLPVVRDIRRAGSAALDLCAVAASRLDAYFEWGLQPWDFAAGALIAREAGARVEMADDRMALAAAPQLFDALRALVRSPSTGG